MKISSIKISNCLTFGQASSEAEATTVDLETSGLHGSLHIMVGPNASGKSNFLTIISRAIKGGIFERCFFNEQYARHVRTEDPSWGEPVMFVQPCWNFHLMPSWGSRSGSQTIWLTLTLNDNDFLNMEALIEDRKRVNELIAKYGNRAYPESEPIKPLPETDIREIRKISAVKLKLESKWNPQARFEAITTFEPHTSPAEQFANQYVRYFVCLQKLIAYSNANDRKPDEPALTPLLDSFAWLDSDRDYQTFSTNVSLTPKQTTQQTSSGADVKSEPEVFGLVKKKLAERFIELLHERDLSRHSLKTEIRKEPLLLRINTLLDEYLGVQVVVEKARINDLDVQFSLQYTDTRRVAYVGSLSSGERSILLLIFSLYAYDLRNGVVIIDEPELHLHPQMQRVLLRLIRQLQRDRDLQFILATHSPVLVDKDTISHVYRFYLGPDQKTRIVKPLIDEGENSLVKILDYTNSSKVFFVDHVLLVEGETDEYFCRFYLDWLIKSNETGRPGRDAVGPSLEVLRINGKTEFNRWNDFLRKFGLQVSFIGDWDNIAQFYGRDIEGLKARQKRFEEQAGRSVKEKAYPALIDYFRTNETAEWSQIEAEIEASYSGGVFILKQGELGDYLGTTDRSLAGIIRFCNERFDAWLNNPKFDGFRAELDIIFHRVLKR